MARNPRRRPRKGELPSNVVRHRGRYRGKVMVNGASHVSETFATPELAAEWVKDLRAADAATERGEPLTLKGAMDLLREKQKAKNRRPGSIDFTEQKFKALTRAWKDNPAMHRIGPSQVHAYMEHRRKEVGIQTLHHEVALLKRLFALGKARHLLLRSPFDNNAVELPDRVKNKRFDYLPREQVESLLARIRAAGEKEPALLWAADLFEFLFLTGLRRAEVARLRVADVDPFKGNATVMAKTEDEQIVRLHERHKAIVGRLIAAAGEDGYLVPSVGKTERSRVTKISEVMRALKKRFGLDIHGAAHVLRHSYGTALVRAGVPLPLVQRAMRHKTVSMTMRYFHESEADMRMVAEAIATGTMPSMANKPARKAKAKAKKLVAVKHQQASAEKSEAM